MVQEKSESISSFTCYNCNEKNYFDKLKFISKNEGGKASEMITTGHNVKEVSIECKSCREINSVTFEY